ncbi:MAG: thioredoxin, partial [Chloroflexi bacterium]|nr:thioredoxin [Chloroflexota bacterium]
MTSEYIIEVSEREFQNEVLAFSSQTPVIVDFWAEWCIPCRTLGPILEKLTQEAQGAFRLAKVNVDENPRLAQQYQISSIPAVKAFHGGEVINEFIGIRPEPEVREFLGSLAPSANDLVVEKGYTFYLEK